MYASHRNLIHSHYIIETMKSENFSIIQEYKIKIIIDNLYNINSMAMPAD